MKKSKIFFHLIAILLAMLLLFNYYKVLNKVMPVRSEMQEIVIVLLAMYSMEKILNFIKCIIEMKEEKVEKFIDSLKAEDVK
ncbi:hypothetical protein [Lagierella massiliensis]|uniref:hypothetical protein n=1 Tax=Lagierella massiliensis TaxID=1689303 RepID=UPI0006D7B009|nr:hypothetical protein [Lagierella massiliensis]